MVSRAVLLLTFSQHVDINLFGEPFLVYRDGKYGWYVVARNFFLLLLNNSRHDQAAVA